MTIVQSVGCDLLIQKFPKQASTKQVFRLLAVEGLTDSIHTQGGQCLIKALLNYTNWNNKTDQYVSYIHLLSRDTKERVIDLCKPSWTGNSTRANVESEIKNFLASASPNETVIFYYDGHGGDNTLNPDDAITSAELDAWLKSGGLPKTYLCVILDSCGSGSFIGDGRGSSFGRNKLVLCSCRSDQLSYSGGGLDNLMRGYFTGYDRMAYPNASLLPLGVIGGIAAAKDLNRDGWLSVLEDFAFAKPSTEQFTHGYIKPTFFQNPVSYNGLTIDPPLVRLMFPTVSFTYSPSTPTVNQTITFDASESHSNNYEWFHNESTIPYKWEWHSCNITYQWDFGDGNITTVTEPIITHKYTAYGNYSVTLNVTDTRNLSNATTINVNVPEALHDVSVTEIKPYRTVLGNASSTSINVTVQNKGDVAETFNITLFYDSNQIGTQTITLLARQSMNSTFNWTTPVRIGNYTITAIASQVESETSIDDNTLTFSLIQVSIQGDVNADGTVNIVDIAIAARAFERKLGEEGFEPNADVNEDKIINIIDLATVARDYGKSL
jgi:hypothetical protein